MMEDFDRAYAYECVARSNAAAGDRGEASKYIKLADEAGQAIKDGQDKQIFLGDFWVSDHVILPRHVDSFYPYAPTEWLLFARKIPTTSPWRP